MTYRADKYLLIPLDVSRCVPHCYCSRSAGCARFVAPDVPGRALGIYSTSQNNWSAETCDGWLPVADYRGVPAQERPVREAIEGLA
ncbi:MAG: hypothetical protein RLZZ373_2627 [Pseudomonadota bacterium]|jgi:hypothetical protein